MCVREAVSQAAFVASAMPHPSTVVLVVQGDATAAFISMPSIIFDLLCKWHALTHIKTHVSESIQAVLGARRQAAVKAGTMTPAAALSASKQEGIAAMQAIVFCRDKNLVAIMLQQCALRYRDHPAWWKFLESHSLTSMLVCAMGDIPSARAVNGVAECGARALRFPCKMGGRECVPVNHTAAVNLGVTVIVEAGENEKERERVQNHRKVMRERSDRLHIAVQSAGMAVSVVGNSTGAGGTSGDDSVTGARVVLSLGEKLVADSGVYVASRAARRGSGTSTVGKRLAEGQAFGVSVPGFRDVAAIAAAGGSAALLPSNKVSLLAAQKAVTSFDFTGAYKNLEAEVRKMATPVLPACALGCTHSGDEFHWQDSEFLGGAPAGVVRDVCLTPSLFIIPARAASELDAILREVEVAVTAEITASESAGADGASTGTTLVSGAVDVVAASSKDGKPTIDALTFNHLMRSRVLWPAFTGARVSAGGTATAAAATPAASVKYLLPPIKLHTGGRPRADADAMATREQTALSQPLSPTAVLRAYNASQHAGVAAVLVGGSVIGPRKAASQSAASGRKPTVPISSTQRAVLCTALVARGAVEATAGGTIGQAVKHKRARQELETESSGASGPAGKRKRA